MNDGRSIPEREPVETMGKVETTTKRKGRPPRRDNRTVFGEYLVDNDMSFGEVATTLGCSRQYVSMIAAGSKYPAADLMWQIEQWSKGAVTMQSWFTGAGS